MPIKNITVLGSGLMGHGIAQISAMANYNVVLRDIEQRFLDKALEKIKWSLQKLVEKKKITNDQVEKYLNNITAVVELKDAVKNADLIIEAVPEDFELKRKVYSELDSSISNKDTIYASNTSTLPITELSMLTNRPNKFIGVHFFNPPQLMKLVEVIPGNKTEENIVKEIIRYINNLNKTPIICKKDVVGFIVNRIFIPIVHEAVYSMERNNVSKEVIDSAVKFNLDFPMGIFELADYTGIDVIYKATVEMSKRDKLVIFPHPKIKQLYDSKELGQKTGQGFYRYSKENYERIDLSKEKANLYAPLSILGVAANNAAWLITNKVCNEEDLNNALRLGMGLKTNIFDLVKRYGTNHIVKELLELEKKYGEFYRPNEYLINI